jgi:hypothetical protein
VKKVHAAPRFGYDGRPIWPMNKIGPSAENL